MTKTQGGLREGAGRKKLDYPFKIIQVRIPLELEEEAKRLVKNLRKEWLSKNK